MKMRQWQCAGAVLAALLVAGSAALAQDAKIKPGLWETTVLHEVVDGRDVSSQMASAQSQMQQAMERMSPEQRQKLESVMGSGNMPGQHAAGANRICISPSMAAMDKLPVDPQGHCANIKVTRSGNKIDYEINCNSDGRTTVGTGQSIIDGDLVTARSQTTITDARGRHEMQSEVRMKYLGADCQGVAPASGG